MLIINASLITFDRPNRILPDYGIYIAGDRIVEIGPSLDLSERHPGDELVDAKGQYVMPGNICAHTHFYGAYSRGIAIPGPSARDFPEILTKLWWPLDKSLGEKDIYFSALVCMIDAIKHGTTTLIDHHASPSFISGSLDWIAKAVSDSGLRASLCYEVTDRDGYAKAREGIDENIRFIRYLREKDPLPDRLAALFGLHASLTLSDDTLKTCAEVSREFDVGFHIHVAEHNVDEYDSIQKAGLRVVDRLQKFGILGPKSIAVHAVHIDAKELAILAQTGTWVTHQPRSNMNNGVGLPRVEEMIRSGIRVCLGNDGFSNSMWEEWKAAYLGHKLFQRDPRVMPADQVMEMAIYNNRDLVEEQFGGLKTGILSPGAVADVIFVDYYPYTPMSVENLPWHIVFGFHESMVTTTIASGKLLMRDRQLITIDEKKIAEEARLQAPLVWRRYEQWASK